MKNNVTYALREHLAQMNKATLKRARFAWLRRIGIGLLLVAAFAVGAFVSCKVPIQ